MTKQRARELKAIAAGLYATALEAMDSDKCGHVSEGVEETIVLAELAKKIMLDVVDWSIEDNLDEGEED